MTSVADSKGRFIGLLILGFFIPPIAVYIEFGGGDELILNFLLYLFVPFGGFIHAWYILNKRRKEGSSSPYSYGSGAGRGYSGGGYSRSDYSQGGYNNRGSTRPSGGYSSRNYNNAGSSTRPSENAGYSNYSNASSSTRPSEKGSYSNSGYTNAAAAPAYDA